MRLLMILSVFILISSCKKTKYVFYSPDNTQCITIDDYGDRRFIINGTEISKQKDNYVLVDISNIEYEYDELFVCWKDEKYEWTLLNPYADLIEIKLDTSRFLITVRYEEDRKGVPIVSKYLKGSGCFEYSFGANRIRPTGNALLERDR